MSKVEGWDIEENDVAAWARNPRRTVDITIDAEAVEVEIDARDAGTVCATIPIAVLREVLRRVDAKGAR